MFIISLIIAILQTSRSEEIASKSIPKMNQYMTKIRPKTSKYWEVHF